MSKKHRHKKKYHPTYQEPSAGYVEPNGPGEMRVAVHGMRCASCEVLIERKFKRVEGVEAVRVNQVSGQAELTCRTKPSIRHLQAALEGTEYFILPEPPSSQKAAPIYQTTAQDYKETFWVFLLILVVYFVLSRFNLIPKGLSVGDDMSYGFIFVIGLVAAISSCIAVTGGLLLAVAGRYAEAHPEADGIKRFRPHLYFNAGRVIGYTIFGGLIGAVGSVFTLSTRLTGVLTIAASLVMIFLGFQLLNIFPALRRFQPKMPKFIAHRVHEASGRSDHPTTPFTLGAATFFLPCGFTQALQLYVLSQGSLTVGALTMLAFSLGTLPALMSLSALSSFLKGATQRYFFRFAGVVVILLGLANIGNGLSLAGTNISLNTILAKNTSQSRTAANLAPIESNKQVISMKVVELEYQPAQFTVRQGVPVEWRIDGSQTSGCASVLTASGLNITVSLPRSGEKVVNFTPEKTGTFPFSCPMGMTTRGASITVAPNDSTNLATPTPLNYTPVSPASPVSPVSSQFSPSSATNSAETQKFTMTVTREQGFYPTNFMAKKNIPVELEVDVQTDISGCMGTMIGSDYDIAQQLILGKNYVQFTPTKTGTLYLTCPMGIGMGEFTITN